MSIKLENIKKYALFCLILVNKLSEIDIVHDVYVFNFIYCLNIICNSALTKFHFFTLIEISTVIIQMTNESFNDQ